MADGGTATNRRRKAKAPATADPIEMAMEAATDDGQAARRFLRKQEQLVGWQIASERAGFVLKGLAIAGVAVAVVGLGAMAVSAYGRERLVIDAFSVPAELEQAGATGEAVASQLKDKLVRMSEETISQIGAGEVQDTRRPDVKVELGDTGVSIDEIDRLLRGWLGKETHVVGEVSRVISGPEKGALALSVRVGGRPGERLVAPSSDLDALLARAAERVYAVRDPQRFGQWLVQQRRQDEASAHALAMTKVGPRQDRAFAYWFLSSAPNLSEREKLPLLAEALRLDPQLPPALNDTGAVHNRLGHSELAVHYWRRAVAARTGPGLTERGRLLGRAIPKSNVDANLGDYAATYALTCINFELTDCTADTVAAVALQGGTAGQVDMNREIRVLYAGRMMALAHDISNASRISAEFKARDSFIQTDEWAREHARLTVALALMTEDWAGMVSALEPWSRLVERRPGLDSPAGPDVWLPLALARLGRTDEAVALANARPLDCVVCVRVRAAVAAALGDGRTADHWFGEAIRMAPSQPLTHAEWARSLQDRGLHDRAIAQAAEAVRKGPRFADPLVIWGEALLAKGDAAGAAAKFQAAAALTPKWGRLHLKWGEALAAQGKAQAAKAAWTTAAGLYLTAPERAELARLQGAR